MTLSSFWIFDSSGFPARWACGNWPLWLGWMHIVSDILIWLAYLAIPLILISFVRRRRDVPFPRLFWLFGAFIVTCGTTHLLEAITFYEPVYRLAGIVKLVTAIVSWATVIALLPVLPKALAMRTPQGLESEVVARTAELAQANAQLQQEAALIDQTYDAVLVWEWNGPITLWNRGAERLYGFSRAEALGQVSHELLRTTRSGGVNVFVNWLEEEGSWEGELEHTTRDGQRIIVETRMVLVRDAQRPYVLEANRDITVRRRMEEELRQANDQLETRVRERTAELAQINETLQATDERFRLLVEGVQECAIFMLDLAGNVITWNTGAERSKGYRAEEIIGRHFSCFYPREDLARGKPEQELRQALAEGRCEDEGWRIRKDGSRFWARVVISSLYDKAGRPRGFAKVTRDITEGRWAHERFRQVVESALNALVMVNPEGKIVLVNAQTERLFGYHRDELVGQPVEVLVPERFRGHHPDFRNHFFASPQMRPMGTGRDLSGRRKDGTEFPVEIGLNPIKTDEGLVVLSAIVDITERKRAEERFRLAVESAPNGMVMIDSEGKIVLVNTQTERLFGYGRDELLGRSVELLVPERFRSRHPEYRSGFFANPQVRSMGVGRDLHGRRKDGTEFPVEIGLNPIKTDEGLVVLSAIVDITERKRADAALRDRERLLRTVTGSAQVGLVVVGAGYRYLFANEAYATIFGLDVHEIVGHRVSEVLAAGWPQIQTQLDRALAGERVAYELTLPPASGGQSARFFTVVYEPRTHDGGEPTVVVVVMDISERKRAEEDLRRLNAELEQGVHRLGEANRELKARTQENETFVYSVSHDLRSPLVNLQGFSKELSRAAQDLRSYLMERHLPQPDRDRGLGILDGPIAKSIRFIQTAVTRLSNIIDALLRLSRVGRVIYQRQRVDVQTIVTRVIESLRGTADERGALIQTRELPAALGDPAALEQIFANLIGNALNYLDSKRPGRIEVGCLSPEPDKTETGLRTLYVRDNGLGITETGRAKVFQPFQRLHPQAAAGEGLGLAIVQRVVERHGGRIWFESAVGQGTTFFVALPAFLDGTAALLPAVLSGSDKGSCP